jgi:pSer/pThr/pTyr-binding forkhead associated (FHA) protein
MGKPGTKLVLGALAGFLAFIIMEPSAPLNPTSSEAPIWEGTFVLVLAGLIGLVLGGYNGYLRGSKWHTASGAGLGLLFGLAGVGLGTRLGAALTAPMGGSQALLTAPLPVKMFVRMLALAPIGMFLGLGIGASSLVWRRALQGAIGGLIGGGIGAFFFDPIAEAVSPMELAMKHVQPGQTAETGTLSRAIYSILLGAGVGLFVGLVENLGKSAWLRMNLGRNEGKEWAVDAPVTVIGRGEMCQVPLFGDPAIAPRHATIVRQGDQYLLKDEGSPAGTFLNGQRVTQAPLFHGATIQIGSHTLQFLMKVGKVPVGGPEMLRAQQGYVATPQPSGAPVGAAAFQGPMPQPMAPSPAMPGGPYGAPMQTQMMPGQIGPAPYGAPTQVMQPQGAAQMPSMPTQVMAPQPQAPAAGGAPTLVAIAGPLTGQRFPITSNLEVGREGSGIALGFDTGASRRHASFSATPGGVIVSDLGSTNGTFVNDQQIQAATISKGDTVRIGITTFRVE